MMKLYEITQELHTALENADDEMLPELLQQFNDKANDLLRYTLNLRVDCEKIKEHCDTLTAKRKRIESRIDAIQLYILNEMQVNNIQSIKDKDGLFVAKIAKNPPSVQVVDENAIPPEFVQVENVIKVDKKAILQHAKDTGEIIAGVEIVTDRQRLSIK